MGCLPTETAVGSCRQDALVISAGVQGEHTLRRPIGGNKEDRGCGAGRQAGQSGDGA